jgi:hypothetical protein
MPESDAEARRLGEDARREKNWQRWGPYLSERQWGTVREDYSATGDSWRYFPFEQAAGRAYRWGEDGLLGICDRQCRLCFALALWNERDALLKERLFGLAGPEGNHGEDVKEEYFYLDATPTSSYLKALYKYPQARFPYEQLRAENQRRSRHEPEFELVDTGVFAEGRYFDVFAEYAKATPADVLIRLTLGNRGPAPARLHVLPTLWFRNIWSWGCRHEAGAKPELGLQDPGVLRAEHGALGRFYLDIAPAPDGRYAELLFTDNETNAARLFGAANGPAYTKDAFHDCVVHGRREAVNPAQRGTKAAAHFVLDLPAGGQVELRLRLASEAERATDPFGPEFAQIFTARIGETEAFYESIPPRGPDTAARAVARQAYAGLLWSKQFYCYIVQDWLDGDPLQPAPPPSHRLGRNHDWRHLYNRDLLSMPDKWEYPWYATWDLAFHMLPLARVDPEFAKRQLLLLLREWYMHPNGQLPAYEWDFGDANPPVHAWACWRVYKCCGPHGQRDRRFLERAFHKLLLNFTWWVNRKDREGRNLFAGGFLGLDNISIFDRSRPLPDGGTLEQADGTAWMAFYCLTMLAIALELALAEPAYEDVASKFFEHFVAIADAMNGLGGTGLWDETDGFYYDHLQVHGKTIPTRIRSVVGIIPLFAVEVLEDACIDRLAGFRKRLRWYLENRRDLSDSIAHLEPCTDGSCRRLLALPTKNRLLRVLSRLLDEHEFLSPYGLRSLSAIHRDHPYVSAAGGQELRIGYVPGDSDNGMFGGNSNWRGPIWLPINYLFIEALERYYRFYGDSLRVEFPTGSGRWLNLQQVAQALARRLANLFLPDAAGRRPCHGSDSRFAADPHWRELVLFHEYFHGDNGRGLGASHQTGWTALVTRLLEDCCRNDEAFYAAETFGKAAAPHHVE